MKKLSNFGIFTSIVVFLFPFIFSNKLFYNTVNAKLIFIYSFMIISFITFSYYLYNKKIQILKINKMLTISVLILISILILSSFFGVNPEKSFFSDISRGTGVLFIISSLLMSYVLSYLLNKNDFLNVFKSIIFSSAFISFFNVLGFLFPNKLGNFFTSSEKLLGNSTFTGTFLFFGIIFTLFYISKIKFNKKIFWFYIILFFIQIINPIILNIKNITNIFTNPLSVLGEAQASSAIILLISSIFFVIYFFIHFTKNNKYYRFLNLSLIIIFISIFSIISMLFINGTKIQRIYIENSSSARLIVWSDSFSAFKERPLLGWGTENFDIAIQKYIDYRYFVKDGFQQEVWFDRAHNLFLDSMVDSGIFGLLSWVFLFFFLIRVFHISYKQEQISYLEFLVLSFMVLGNIIQLQTSFQNINTYFYFSIILGYGLYYDVNLIDKKIYFSKNINNIKAIVFVLLSFFIFYHIYINELPKQNALFKVFQGHNIEQKISYINKFTKNNNEFESLRISSSGMVKGLLLQISNNSITNDGILNAKKELDLYVQSYEKFIKENPYHYRARVNLVYLYSVQTILGDNRIKDTEFIISSLYELSPKNPLNDQLKALNLLYAGKINEAEDLSKEGVVYSHDIDFSKNVFNHILNQKKKFPEITFLRLENL